MKTTIIDILNKIANGKDVPKVIKYTNTFYEFDKELDDYSCNGYRLFGNELEESYKLIEHLKDKVEILETVNYML